MKLAYEQKQRIAGFALLIAAVTSMLVITIETSVGGDILTSIRNGQTEDSYAYNITTEGLDAFDDLSDWFPTIIAVVAAVVILTFVMLLSAPGTREA